MVFGWGLRVVIPHIDPKVVCMTALALSSFGRVDVRGKQDIGAGDGQS